MKNAHKTLNLVLLVLFIILILAVCKSSEFFKKIDIVALATLMAMVWLIKIAPKFFNPLPDQNRFKRDTILRIYASIDENIIQLIVVSLDKSIEFSSKKFTLLQINENIRVKVDGIIRLVESFGVNENTKDLRDYFIKTYRRKVMLRIDEPSMPNEYTDNDLRMFTSSARELSNEINKFVFSINASY